MIHPQKILRKENSKPGDKLILTKPLGTGIINTAVKAEMASEEASDQIMKSMSTLNRKASEIMQEIGVNACTDITGFGLLGHASEMVEDTNVCMLIYANSIPIFPEAKELAAMGMIPAGLYRNRDFRKSMVEIGEDVNEITADILFDPQTSGGLLIALPAAKADTLLSRLHAEGVNDAAVIGEVLDNPRGKIVVRQAAFD